MKIKTKLTLGVGLLFILIILLSAISTRYIIYLKLDTENILLANYNSLEYARGMLGSLEESDQKDFSIFEQNLALQEKNITEIGEKEITQIVRNNFSNYKSNLADSIFLTQIRQSIYIIMDLNMQAIERKSEVASATANNAILWVSITGTLCFIIAFTLLINLPSSIANPLKEITESIKQIAAKKYSERVHFERHSEFGELAISFNTMAEKLEEYNNSSLAKLMMEKTRIETLINNMKDPVIGLDQHLKILFVNEVAIKILGLKKENLIGENAEHLALKNDLLRTLILNIRGEEQGEEINLKPIKIYADNKEGYFEKEILHISIIPTGELENQLIGHVIVLRNVTQHKELDFAKTNFIATISHEFKTPISAIKMSLQLLENKKIGAINSEQAHLLESINNDADRLLKITGELLNMTQVESGNIQLSILPSDPKEIVLYAVNTTKIQAQQKQINVNTFWPNSLPKVYADSDKTTWVLTNLISNAIRFSYQNSIIKINIIIEGNKVKIEVKDTGQGIDPQYKSKIFDRYYRVPGTKKEGTGLGLSISKEFIEAQGGSIHVESEFGVGSTFTITLNCVQ